ncbi:MAG: peptide chain release factor N(5)-glutamine methyltransferase [Thermoleophilaceae bacterium]|nr:peptide chain release factor N(5)-glutamine methyltransferase [Thermoleophilaceae bacterium]
MAASATARALIDDGESRLAAAGIDTARLDAELLLAAAAGVTRSEIVAGLVDPLAGAELYEAWLSRRAEREPLAYITGRQGFRRIELRVDPRVLIPRPETELLVAVAKVDRPCGILDVATGSGAVALALADELPDATITAADISADALAVARANADALGAAGRVTFFESDLLDEIEGVFDAIVANLPYVVADEIDGLQAEVARFEPRLALDGGPDGFELVRRLAVAAPAQLKPGGTIALEIGQDQALETEAILRAAGFVDTARHEDLNGIERVVSGRKRR